METGNKALSATIFKQGIHLKADHEQEAAQSGLLSFVNISRHGVLVMKRTTTFKAVELLSFKLPFSESDSSWIDHVSETLSSPEFVSVIGETEPLFSISDSKVTLVPASIYSSQQKNKNYEFLFGKSDSVILQEQSLSNSDSIGIFSFPKRFSELITSPIQSSYLNWLDTLPTDSNRVKAYLVVEEKQFVLVIKKDGELFFSNWFEHGKPADILYYLMASLETLKILHSEVELTLYGEVAKGDEVYLSISKFISKLSLGKRSSNLTYSYSFNQLADHKFPFIFAATCA